MSTMRLEKILFWIVRLGTYILPFFLLVILNDLFFPFITGKNFLFRIAVEIMIAAWIGLLFINFKKYWPRWNLVSIAFVIFIGTIFLSAIFGVDFKNSFWSNFERMDGLVTHLHLLFLFLVLTGTFRTRREWFILFGISITVSVLLAFYGLLEYSGAITSFAAQGSRIMSTLGNPLYVAAYLTFNIFLILFLWLSVRSVVLKWILGILFLFELAVFFLTGSRGAFLGILAGVGAIFLLGLLMTKGTKKKIILVSAVIILALIPILFNIFRDVSFIKNNGVISRFSNISLSETTVQSRFTIWGMAFKSFKERPVLGWGFGNFIIPYAKNYNPKMYGNEPWFDRVHNMPLEWLVAGGVVGFSAYAFLIFAVFWTIAKAARVGSFSKNQAFIFAGMMVAYLIQLLFVFDTLGTYMMFVFFSGFFLAATVYPEEWDGKSSIFRASKNKKGFLHSYKISVSRLSAVAGVFAAAVFIIYFVNVRPFLANRALMGALIYFDQGQIAESYESFQKAVKLAKGTIGETEITEHLAFNIYKLFSNPELLRKPEGENFYRLTKDRLEEEVARSPKKYPNIKHNILLAQLYHQKAVLDGDASALQKAFENYEKVILDAAPNYVSVYPIYANLLAQTGNFTGAVMLTQKASKILESAGKYDERIFYSLPLFYTAAKRYNEAYKALADIYEKYGKLSPSGSLDPKMMENIITTTGSQGKEALPFLEKVYSLDKNLISAALMLAQLHAAEGNKSEASFYASEALKLDPSLESRVNAFLRALEEVETKK